MTMYGLLGYPLSHSFSKKYFTEKFEKEGLAAVFENFSIPSISELPSILKSHTDLKGLAVTIPYKQQVLDYLDSNELPAGLNACNCIRIKEGHLTGYNTDYIGFKKSFEPLLQPHHTNALVLGNGGATEAVVFALKTLGIEYKIVSRELHGNSTLTYRDISGDVLKEHPVIVNTTPLGMYPAVDTYPDIPYDFLDSSHLLYDLVYNPGLTEFLRKGKERGAVIKNGSDMLIEQAEENWRIWNL